MSASAKKKLRKEETALQLTEKQLAEKNEAKKLKLYTTIFVAAIAVVLVAALAIAGTNFFKNSGFVEKSTIAAVVDDHEVNTVELSYYYTDLINNTYSNWYSAYGESTQVYLSLMGLDTTLPLDQQTYADNQTWADYFLESAVEQAKSDHLLVKAANADGYVLSEEAQAELDASLEQLPAVATIYGYTSADNYLRAMYGPGANESSFTEYAQKSALAQAYYNNYTETLQIDDAAIRAYEADKFGQYSSYSYATYTINYNNFLTGGTENDDGVMTYSDEERDAARAAAKAAADALPKCSTVEELNAAIAAIQQNEGTVSQSTIAENRLYSSISDKVRQWLAEDGRKEGDFVVLPNESTSTNEAGEETTVVNNYDLILFLERNDNTRPLANVRHILVNFTGGTTDENGTTTYSDAEKEAAKAMAQGLLDIYAMGEQTEEAFAELAAANTADTASAATGGLYEDITPEQGIYVESFTNWAVDPERKAGDTGIIESTYGYHVMYYVGDDELTYRDHMIKEDILDESIATWYEGIIAGGEAALKDTSRIKKDFILTPAQ